MSILKQYDEYKTWYKTSCSNLVDNSVGISVDNSVYSLVDSSVDTLVDTSVDSSVDNSVACSVDNSVDNSVSTSVNPSVDSFEISCGNYVMISKIQNVWDLFWWFLVDLICLVYGSPKHLLLN